ncbi:MAG: D-2-hydroxyacid dehydrogenase [Ectothiorhodospiraceae bacterium AqS1]|nr:D-2-hydroxyacid dehydrogenase [Ectothiorhodospiraceae bacterium AqS1]
MTATPSSLGDPVLAGDGDLVVHFAHPAYRLAESFARRDSAISHFQTWDRARTLDRLGEGHVLVLSGLWSNEMLEGAANLRYIQVCAAGYDQFDRDCLRAEGILLANGSGVNRNAVGDHAMAMLLALTRQIHSARDRQRERVWRPMISDIGRREEEIEGKRMLIYGLGAIGSRLARLAGAFGIQVIGIKRDLADHDGAADELRPPADFLSLLPEVDILALTCPLTAQTENLVDAAALARMKPTAYLVNVARGRCVDEAALFEALKSGAIAGAGLDTFVEEPLAADSPLWGLENALITPHSAGETRRYEENVIDILLTNIRRLQKGDESLVNRIV